MASGRYFAGDLEQFRAAAERAALINPNNSRSIAYMGLLTAYSGDWEQGVALVERAIDLNPNHPTWYHQAYFVPQYFRRDYEAALLSAKRYNLPGFYWHYVLLAMVYGQLGRLDEAQEAISNLTALYPGYSDVARFDIEKWIKDEALVAAILEGLEKAGLFDEPEAPARPVIAVLPFTNMSGDPEQEYFSDGITEDLITELSRRRMLVIARNSSFQYKDRAVDVREVGRELGARYVVEGSVRRAGDAIKVTAQLIDAGSGEHIWAETYERVLSPTNIFEMQEQITGQIATAIGHGRGAIAREGQERARRKPPEHLSSYECVLLAQAYWDAMNATSHAQVRDCLERVIMLDPDYVDAWAALAAIYAVEHNNRYNPRPEPLRRALAAAHEAVRLDPNYALAHFQLAYVYFFRHELDLFFVETEKALSLSPNDAGLLSAIGHFTAFAGEWDRGIAMIKESMTLDPLMQPERYFVIGHDHLLKGEYKEAVATYKKMNLPDHFAIWRSLAVAYAHMGRLDEAKAAADKMLALYPGYEKDIWAFLRDWNFSDDFVTATIDGLRKAGLDIPDEPAAAD